MKKSETKAHIVIKKDGKVINQYTIKPADTVITIGRNKGNDISLRDEKGVISRVHAAIIRCKTPSSRSNKTLMQGPEYMYLLRDLGSTHGTKVGKTFARKRILRDGDEIHICSHTLVWKNSEVHEGSDPGIPLEERFKILQPVSELDAATICLKKRQSAEPLTEEQEEFIEAMTKEVFANRFTDNPLGFLSALMPLLHAEKAVIWRLDDGNAHIVDQKGFDRELTYCRPGFLDKVKQEGSILQEGALWVFLAENIFISLFREEPPPFTKEDMNFACHACKKLTDIRSSDHEVDQLTPWDTPIVGLFDNRKECLKIAPAEDTEKFDILLLGETGTGKEVLARFIHDHSRRKNGPFIIADLTTIPSELLYSELFGHEKGAFTGATERKAGYFEMAQGGTLFLDEIGDVPERAQVALLSAIQTRSIQRLGAKESISVDIRLIGATDRNLEKKMQVDSFRRALYERFHRVTVLSLRERPNEIPLLAYYFLDRNSKAVRAISREALEIMKKYDWLGNVNALKDAIREAALDKKEVIFSWDLPDRIRDSIKDLSAKCTSKKTLEETEKDRITEVWKETRGNISETYRILGISRAGLYKKIDKYGLKYTKEKRLDVED